MNFEEPATIGGFFVGGLYQRRLSRGKGHMVVVGPCSRHQDCDRCVSYVECWLSGEGLETETGCASTKLLLDIFEITPMEEREE